MSGPLCIIGSAILERIGLNPQGFDYRSKARAAKHDVFDDEPLIQPTGMGERLILLKLAARPHVMGGMQAYAALKGHHEGREVVPYLRLAAGNVGEMMGDVYIESLSHLEEKLAPDGVGRRHEFIAELLLVGRQAGGGF